MKERSKSSAAPEAPGRGVAELAGVGPSTLARSMILNVLNPSKDRTPNDQWVTSVSERLSTLEARIGAEG